MKIAIVGAGAVGSHVAFSLLSRLPPEELVLIDINKDLACGVALDLEDTRGFLGFSTTIKGGSAFSLLRKAAIVVITAGIARKQGMTRLDLLKTNVAVVSDIARQVKRYAPRTIVIVVTNPLDYITYIVKKETAFPRNRVMGMGSSLDTSRLLNIVHAATGISVTSINGFVYGQHSKDMIVDLRKVEVAGQQLKMFLKKKQYQQIGSRVQSRGAEIVRHLKTKSACFAPGLATSVLIEAVVNNANKIMPVSAYLQGEYGLRDVCVGVPCVINRDGISAIITMPLSQAEKKELQAVKKVFQTCMI